jgi:aldehyde dehydrogenase (NAD+)
MYTGWNFINGMMINQSVPHFDAINPANEEVYGQFPISDNETVCNAVSAARAAQPEWARMSRIKRADLFDNLAQLIKRDHENLRDVISIETGKNLNESHAEVIEALHMCQTVAAMGRQPFGEVYSSELETKDAYVIRKPRGVVAIISPWNFPFAIGSFWSAGPALLEGNTVVHKPSELTPMVNDMAWQLYLEAGFPPGVFNLVHGDGSTGAALVRSSVDVILFTGSAEVAQDIRRHCADCFGKTASIECGSKSSTILFNDGSHDLALDVCVASAFKLSGQRCVSSGRIFVQRDVFEGFKEDFVQRVRDKVHPGDPMADDDAFYGPLISAEHMQRVREYNILTQTDPDVKVLIEGLPVNRKGFYLTPHVYQCEWSDKRFLKEEVFGPHVALIPFDDLDDVIAKYNDTDYGLALGVITDDFRKHREIVNRCTAGMIYINGGSIAAESHMPFSSWKKSGYGSSAAATWKAVTHTTAVTVNYERGKVTWAQGMK